jgi:hypothetical protein
MFTTTPQTNIQILEYVDTTFIKGTVNCSFADRMFYVIIDPSIPTLDRVRLISYLEKNNFYLIDDELYCRFKNRQNVYITPEDFDKENYGVREEMTRRINNRR